MKHVARFRYFLVSLALAVFMSAAASADQAQPAPTSAKAKRSPASVFPGGMNAESVGFAVPQTSGKPHRLQLGNFSPLNNTIGGQIPSGPDTGTALSREFRSATPLLGRGVGVQASVMHFGP